MKIFGWELKRTKSTHKRMSINDLSPMAYQGQGQTSYSTLDGENSLGVLVLQKYFQLIIGL